MKFYQTFKLKHKKQFNKPKNKRKNQIQKLQNKIHHISRKQNKTKKKKRKKENRKGKLHFFVVLDAFDVTLSASLTISVYFLSIISL